MASNLVADQRHAEVVTGELVPGTEIMRDSVGIRQAHDAADHVLIPRPSDDPADPLNWPKRWKYIVIGCQAIFTFISVMSGLSIAPMFPLLGAEFNLNLTRLGLLTGSTVIANGYSNIFIIPFSNIFGRRGTLLFFGLIMLACHVWSASAKSYESLLVARVVVGAATGTAETIMVQVTADMFFLHERGFWMGVYFTSYFTGLFIGPVISGNIVERHGWRSMFWLSFALTAAAMLALVVVSPETKFHRTGPSHLSRQPSRIVNTISEKDVEQASSEHFEVPSSDESEGNEQFIVGNGHPSKQQFKLIQRSDPRWKNFFIQDIVTPIRLFLFPIILWASLNVAGAANTLLFFNMTQSTVLGGPPYNFTPGQVGYSNFAFVVGAVVGVATAGPFSDWVATKLTIRNGGIREAEMRLPALIPYFFLVAVGNIVGSLAYDRQWAWPYILVFGFGITGISVATIPTIAISYAVDCYKPVSGEIMVCATVIKNSGGFAMSYWVPPLVAREGLLTVGMAEMAMTLGPMALGVPLYFFGKRLRTWTKDSNVHRMEAEI